MTGGFAWWKQQELQQANIEFLLDYNMPDSELVQNLLVYSIWQSSLRQQVKLI
jgi:hypothetical protein